MKSVNDSLDKIISDKPFIYECLKDGLINITALAKQIQKQVEEYMGKEIKITTISMALHRYSEQLKESPLEKLYIDKTSEINSRTNLTLYTIKKSSSLLAKINSFYNYINLDEGDIFTVIHGTRNMSLLTNERLEMFLERLLKDEQIIVKNPNIGAIYILIPSEFIEIPGFFYLITKKIASNNINLLGIANILSEVLLVMREEYVPKAFEMILELINYDKRMNK